MAKIAIISDTHNNQKLLRKSLENESELDYIFHLGDYYDDLNNNYDLLKSRILIQVPGIYHQGYAEGTLPKKMEITIENWKFLLVHDIKDAKRSLAKNQIILYGHSHLPAFKRFESKLYLNPGHLKRAKDRGNDASYCLAELNKNEIQFYFKNPDGEIIKQYNVIRQELEDK